MINDARPMTLVERLRYYLGFALVGLCTVSVCAICTFLLVGVRPLSGRRIYRILVGALAQTPWIRSCLSLLEVDKVRITGDLEFDTDPNSSGAIVIANHQLDFDGFLVWFFLDLFSPSHPAQNPEASRRPHELNFSPLSSLKILLKADLKYVPFYGWGMWFFEYVFLERNWKKDRRPLEKSLESFRRDRLAPHVLIFPEGTTLNEKTQAKGNQFALENNRPVFTNLISPRTTGFNACLEAMVNGADNGEKLFPSVYDLTIAYDGFHGEVPDWTLGFGRARDTDIGNLDSYLAGRPQRCIHVHFKKFDGKDVGETFLDDRWQEKDQLLSEFVKEQAFPSSIVGESRDIERPRFYGTVARLLLLPFVLLPLLPIVASITWPLALLKALLGVVMPSSVYAESKRSKTD